jgi:hypothetical protein
VPVCASVAGFEAAMSWDGGSDGASDPAFEVAPSWDGGSAGGFCPSGLSLTLRYASGLWRVGIQCFEPVVFANIHLPSILGILANHLIVLLNILHKHISALFLQSPAWL